MLTWLSDQESWLLIIDNASIPPSELLTGRLPPGKSGRILITTKDPEYKMIAQPSPDGYYQLGGLEPEESMTLLLKKAQRDYTDTHLKSLAEPIVRDLLYLPLATVATGAKLRNFRGTLQDYTNGQSVASTPAVTSTPVVPSLDQDQTMAGRHTPGRALVTNSPWATQNVLTFGEYVARNQASSD